MLLYCFHVSLTCVWKEPLGETKQVGRILQSLLLLKREDELANFPVITGKEAYDSWG